MQQLGVKGIHIAERDTQRAKQPKPHGGVRQHLVGRGLRVGRLAAGRTRLGHPREVDAGERPSAMRPAAGAAIYLTQPGANTRVRSWTPTAQSASTASWSPTTSRSRSPTTSRLREGGKAVYRPTCHYAYHPCDDAVLSLHEMFGQAGKRQPTYPNPRRARDRRRHRRARRAALRPRQERLLVRLPALDRGDARARALPERHRPAGDLRGARRHGLGAGESRTRGIVEADEMDFQRCLEVQLPYLGPVIGTYTDWTPLTGRPGLFPEDIDKQRSLAVQERAGAVSRGSRRDQSRRPRRPRCRTRAACRRHPSRAR